MNELLVRPLNREEFEPFGDVIEADSTVETIAINDGYAIRYKGKVTKSMGKLLISFLK